MVRRPILTVARRMNEDKDTPDRKYGRHVNRTTTYFLDYRKVF